MVSNPLMKEQTSLICEYLTSWGTLLLTLELLKGQLYMFVYDLCHNLRRKTLLKEAKINQKMVLIFQNAKREIM